MDRRTFFKLLGMGGVASLWMARNAHGLDPQTPVPRVKVKGGFYCRPQKTADDLAHEMDCWSKGILDDHDAAIVAKRLQYQANHREGVGQPPVIGRGWERFLNEPCLGLGHCNVNS